MAKDNDVKRGCGAVLPSLVMLLGAGAVTWALWLGWRQGGSEVSVSTGLTFYLGWFCGLTLFGLGVVLAIIQRMIRAAGGTAGRFLGGDKGGDLLPDLGFINDIFGRG